MTLLEELLWPNRMDEVAERRSSLSLTDYEQWVDLGLTSGTASGVSVSPSNALKMSAVFACVRILGETLASLPLIVYERMDRGKRRAESHHLFSLLKDRPNPDMTSFEYRETLQGHLGLYGNAYSYIDYDGAGKVTELFPLRPDRMMQIVELEGRWMYYYQLPTGELRWLDEAVIWHLRGIGSDGRIGYSPISLMRQAIGLGMAAEEFGARFFGNDARPGVVLEHPGILSEEAQKHLKESWETKHGSLSRKHKIGILEEGMSLKEIGIPPEDSQFIQTRKFQLQEIARIYRIPPHMLADLDRATFSNIEHQSIEFVVHTMRPWLVRWEQSIKQRLMLSRDRDRYFPEFLIDGLLRGDIQSRYQAYATARQNGWLSANDIRERENMNPIEGGDTYLVPLNLIPARSAREQEKTEEKRNYSAAEERALAGRRRLVSAYHNLFAEAAGKIIRREVNDITRKAKALFKARNIPELSLWLDTFYDEHREFIDRNMRPIFRSYGEAVAAEAADEIAADPLTDEQLDELALAYSEDFAAHHIGISLAEIRTALRNAREAGEDPLDALAELFERWEEVRSEEIAGIESYRANNAMAVSMYGLAGILVLRWRAFGKSCPYCSRLDGLTVGIQEAFLGAGEEFQPEGADTPLKPKFDVRHPPAHRGCDCMIMAGV